MGAIPVFRYSLLSFLLLGSALCTTIINCRYLSDSVGICWNLSHSLFSMAAGSMRCPLCNCDLSKALPSEASKWSRGKKLRVHGPQRVLARDLSHGPLATTYDRLWCDQNCIGWFNETLIILICLFHSWDFWGKFPARTENSGRNIGHLPKRASLVAVPMRRPYWKGKGAELKREAASPAAWTASNVMASMGNGFIGDESNRS